MNNKDALTMREKAECFSGYLLRNMPELEYVMLDTGAVIDIENTARKLRKYDREATSQVFYDTLSRVLNSEILVTSGVQDECENHYSNHFVNGSREISRDTHEIVSGFFMNYAHLLNRSSVLEHIDPERIGLDVFWASKLAFPSEHKKSFIDPPTYVDRDIVRSAAELGFSLEKAVNESIHPVGQIAIISTDSHVYNTVNSLIFPEKVRPERYQNSSCFIYRFLKDKIKVFSTRDKEGICK